ncbi:MAG: nucleotidyl transferase AbiEii/AbiGii toxin family protein [Candidatus Diapherotrites archaeon]
MRLPLFNRLKNRLHKDTALLQDEIVDIVYSVEPSAVLHGGTAVWRCYSSNRFSEDLDFYLGSGKAFKEKFLPVIESRNLSLQKFKQTKTTIFSKIAIGNAEVRFEAALRKPDKIVVASYEKVDGTFLSIFTLAPEDLLLEKISAFENRRLARDLYDIVSLLPFVRDETAVKSKALAFVESAEKPVDEKALKALVFSGAIPSFEQAIAIIKRRFK